MGQPTASEQSVEETRLIVRSQPQLSHDEGLDKLWASLDLLFRLEQTRVTFICPSHQHQLPCPGHILSNLVKAGSLSV